MKTLIDHNAFDGENNPPININIHCIAVCSLQEQRGDCVSCALPIKGSWLARSVYRWTACIAPLRRAACYVRTRSEIDDRRKTQVAKRLTDKLTSQTT